MPAFATHYIFLKELEDELRSMADFDFDPKVGGVGCQGPDVFLFHRLYPPFKLYKSLFGISSKLHRSKPEKIFNAFCDYLKITQNRDIAKSYIYAFILHYSLDRNCHPYVYARQDEIVDSSKHANPLAAHNQVEHAVDTYLLYNRMGIYPPSIFTPSETFTADDFAIDEIARLLQFVVRRVCDKDLEFKEVRRAITDTASLQDTLADKNGGASRLAHALEIPFAPAIKYFKFSASIKPKDLETANKYANIRKESWTSPYDNVTRNSSFEELFESSKSDALELIGGFEAVCRGEATAKQVTQNISFLTGMEVK